MEKGMVVMGKKPLIVLTGPTCAGKTKLSIALAKAVGGEVVSADSMQVYRGMDIGTAKIKKEEMDGVPHHLIDILDPEEEFNVVLFQELAKKAMEAIYSRGKVPIIVGGTGFYIQSVVNEINFTETQADLAYRVEMEAFAKVHGAEALHDKLTQIDPASAAAIHANNIKRTIRALEFFRQTGRRLSEHNEEQRQHTSPYQLNYFVLHAPREQLYQRIDRRVDQMMRDGLKKEVIWLRNRGCARSLTSMQGLGYKELYAYFEGELTEEEAVESIKRNTRHFAKRQLTWFRREKQVKWLNKEDFKNRDELILQHILNCLS